MGPIEYLVVIYLLCGSKKHALDLNPTFQQSWDHLLSELSNDVLFQNLSAMASPILETCCSPHAGFVLGLLGCIFVEFLLYFSYYNLQW